MENSDVIDIFLNPGDYFVGDASFRVRTLLGSCVSITLWHPRSAVGAMSHFLLPGRSPNGEPDARYAEDALALMLAELRGCGVRGSECEAKIFGGGDMFPGQRRSGLSIGQQNGAAARALLEAHTIRVASQCLYGAGHRQIMFEIASGDVWSRQIDKAVNARKRTGHLV